MSSLLTRRFFLGSSLGATAALLVSTALPRMAMAAGAGGRLVVANDSEPRQLNPAIAASNGVFFIASKVIETLGQATFEGVKPLLAASWAGGEDGLSITFRLRDGIKWHDGKPFTSEDVAFSAMEVWKPLQNIGRELFANLEKVETPSPDTAVFRFSKPTPLQLIENALPVVSSVLPKHLYEGTDIAANPANSALVGTGPFTFAEYKPGQYYLLKKNPDYWQKGQPLLDEIVFQVLPDRAAAASSLEAGEVQLACFSAVPLSDLDRIKSVDGLEVVTKGYEDLTYQLTVEINHRTKELQDLKVRQAIAFAIDRKFVLDTIFLGYGTIATGPVPESAKTFYTADVTRYDFDTDKANALLDEAGYKKGADGVRFKLRLLPAPYFNETKQFGDYLRQALSKIGIDATIVSNDSAGHQKAVYTDHAFDLAIAPTVFRADPAISTTILVRSGIPDGVPFSNQGGYKNAALDQIIDEALVTLDPAKRVALYQDFQRKVTEDLPLINVVDWTFTSVASTAVKNIANTPRWAVSSWADTELDG
ncbi:ABC transporter substrate-binding protein [Paracoccus aminophilus]|uniref:Peptide/nickel transport system, substrate-binding protein n=1 Tax=Paracoccus aminophilus JCM 7686 TaxID=1367847 RepID=S5YD54_PARAH|nr:ABC transporter substrate-binding protein [Paracoccus aminophilus]AGT09393.1 peptide/nickel transport system, substrate-binding protein [Paracoccus aminophilus JCM 7686]